MDQDGYSITYHLELRGNLETRHWSKISKTLPILASAGSSSSFVGFM
jgi:hypothetical protein